MNQEIVHVIGFIFKYLVNICVFYFRRFLYGLLFSCEIVVRILMVYGNVEGPFLVRLCVLELVQHEGAGGSY